MFITDFQRHQYDNQNPECIIIQHSATAPLPHVLSALDSTNDSVHNYILIQRTDIIIDIFYSYSRIYYLNFNITLLYEIGFGWQTSVSNIMFVGMHEIREICRFSVIELYFRHTLDILCLVKRPPK